nr:hypothetical protein [Desulfobulbaceae bacterium]
MRVTLNTIYTKIQTNLGQISRDMDRINERISTGLEMSKISDDPVNLVSALRFRTTIVEMDQFTENIKHGETLVNASEAALVEIKDMAIRAKTLAIQATDPALTPSNREAISLEIKNMLDQAIQLGNTQINGKYIFGGYRTSGYTETEPAPFVLDQGNGHWINGSALTPLDRYLTSSPIASAAASADLGDNDLFINGQHIGQVDLTTGADVNGVNMIGANNLKTQINVNSGLYSEGTATADTTGSTFQFNLNGVAITVNTAALDTATAVATKTIAAINAESINTGVTAFIGNATGTNGGPTDSVIFQNVTADDTTPIEVTNFNTVLNGGATLGFTNFSKPTEYFTATLTTQGAGVAPTDLLAGSMDFSINGVNLAYNLTAVATDAARAQQHVEAINQASSLTGVTALLGTGTNGGPANSVILQNTEEGDETAIVLTDIAVGTEDILSGLAVGAGFDTYSVGAGNNTGQVSLASDSIISITTSATDDTILDLIGLGGGSVGNYDDAADGQLTYGYPLNEGDLKINGTAVPATSTDSLSTIFAEASAAAKASAINSITDQTGVTANIIPVNRTAPASVEAGTELSRLTGTVTNTEILANTLAINGTALVPQIDAGAITNGLNMEKAYNAVTQINTISATTNVAARLTTLLAGGVAATGTPTAVEFTLNGNTVSFSTGGISAKDSAQSAISAINAISAQTGVEATLGDGTNGGATNSIILNNIIRGNENSITVSGVDAGEDALIGFAVGTTAASADATHNTGQISFESDAPISITSPLLASPGADIIINELGLSSATAIGVGVGSVLEATMSGTLITAGDLAVNGKFTTADIPADNGVATNGVRMTQAFSAKTVIEAADPNVVVNLTTMTNFGPIAGPATADESMSFTINGELVNVSYSLGDTGTSIADKAVTAINLVAAQSGVTAFVGDGSNGGPANSIVFKNTTIGNDSAIVVSNFTLNSSTNDLGFTNFSQAANATNNSGQITITSANSFDLSSPTTVGSDAILDVFGLGGGLVGGLYDTAGDGIIYGSQRTGTGTVSYGATPEYLSTGDLTINGVDIFSIPTAITDKDSTMALMNGINAKTAQTGIQATRGADGKMVLTALDGRNMHIQTSRLGENVTHLNGGSLDQVFFGSLQLSSDRKFSLESELGATTLTPNEVGLAAIGMSGGAAVTGEPDDTAGDGKIDVFNIRNQIGTVRYNGDRENGLEIKIGKTSTMVVGENGEDGMAATTVFTTLKSLEDFLNNKNFTTVTSFHQATDTSQLLNSRSTGLEPEGLLPDENLFTDGRFTVTVTDHDYYPARTSALTVDVNTSTDTLETIARKIDGMAHISAAWGSDGHLKIESENPSRYTIDLGFDSSNFLNATGVSSEFIVTQAISESLNTIDALIENLTEQISDFGARSNRIQIQSNIYANMLISTKENLSIVQDTDMIKAVMDLKAKEVSYQAALSAAAKTMQLSLVDFL